MDPMTNSQGSAAEKGTQNAVKKNKGGQRNNARETNGLGEPRPVTWEDVEVVKNLIERCMRMYLNKDQVVESLWEYAKIVPEFTEMVWEKLAEDNPGFFIKYYYGLIACQRISTVNRLLEKLSKLEEEPKKSLEASIIPHAESTALNSFAQRVDGNIAGGPPAFCTNDKESKESSPEAVVYNGNPPSNNNDNNSNLPANMDGIISSEEVFDSSFFTPMDFDWLQDLPDIADADFTCSFPNSEELGFSIQEPDLADAGFTPNSDVLRFSKSDPGCDSQGAEDPPLKCNSC